MKQKKVGLALGFLILLLLIGSAAIGYAALPRAEGQIELSNEVYDFGPVPNTGPVSHTFQVRNVGDGPLSIGGVSTSCGCTTAEIDSRRLSPGEATNLTVTYDPLAHGGALGQFMRLVYIRSDDPETPEASLTIRVTVVEP